MKLVTVIIPYKEDRGWLDQAVASVPKDNDIQLILSKGKGNWPMNFNKALPQAEGQFIRYLHEDDMLTEHSIAWSVNFFSKYPKTDFLHGKAIEKYESSTMTNIYTPMIQRPTFEQLLQKNVIHSATVMYRKKIFDAIGGFNENSNVYSFEEFEFNLRCLKAGFRLEYINAPLAIYRRHSKQIIRTCDKVERRKNRKELLKLYGYVG